MELDVFAGQEKSELSMIEVARAILETRGRDNEMYFNDLVNEIQNYLEKSDADIRNALPFFYSDLNTDGSFIPLGDNKWGLRSWYAIDEIDEEVITLEDTDENAPKRKNKKVNAFMDGDEDAIDYNDDDPEDENFTPDSDSLEYDDDSEDDEKAEVESYDSELNEIIPDDDLDDVELSEEDDDEELTDEEKEAKKRKLAIENGYDMEKSFASKSVWARIAVIAAGPVFNFLLAFVCAVVIVGSLGYDPCDIDVVKDNSPATEAGLQEGDVITKVNGHKVTFYRDFYFYRAYNADKTLNITFTRDGEKMTTTVTPQHIKQQKYQVGIMMNENCLISSVTKDSPAEKAGLKANDVIKAVDGTAMKNSSNVTEAITSSGGKKVVFTVTRDGKNVDVTVEPKKVEVESYDTGFVVYGDRVKTSPIGTLKYSVEEVGYSVKTVIQSLGMLFTGKIGFDSLLGPVGTVSTMSEIVEESKADGAFYVFLNLMNLAALISANLGVMNLLPIPALDGGRLVFLIIEALRGKPVKREHEGIVNFIGMILLVILMIVVLLKDIMALF